MKVLSCRFQQCLEPFPMLIPEGSSETDLFRHLSKHVFRSPYFPKYLGYEGHLFFPRRSKFDLHPKHSEKNRQKGFCFIYNWTPIACIKLSLLRTEYLSSVFNVLTNSPKIFHITQRNFFELNLLLTYKIDRRSKFDLHSKYSEKNRQKGFCFIYNWTPIACIKLSLLRTEYLSSVFNVLTNSPKIFHITQRNFFELNLLLTYKIDRRSKFDLHSKQSVKN